MFRIASPMYFKCAVTLVAFALAGVAPGVLAQEIDPGLWEVSSKMESPDGSSPMAAQMARMQEQLRGLPPQVRAMMEKQMASAGLNVGIGEDAVSIKLCITPEDAQAGPVHEGQQEGDCTYTQVSQEGNVWSGRMVCTKPKMTGDFTTTLHDRGHHTTEAQMEGESIGRLNMKVDSRRIGSDCGTIAPVRG